MADAPAYAQQRYACAEECECHYMGLTPVQLNFSLLPSIEYRSILKGLDSDVDMRLQQLGLAETLNRARGAAMLFDEVRGSGEPWRNEAYIRGGLCEFGSIEEALARDVKMRLPGLEVHGIGRSENPLLHFMSLLRNVNLHAVSFSTTQHHADVLYLIEEPPLQRTITVSILTDLTPESLLRKREAKKRYSWQDMATMVTWFNERQKIFGVSHLLTEGVKAYCAEVLDLYEPSAHNSALNRTDTALLHGTAG